MHSRQKEKCPTWDTTCSAYGQKKSGLKSVTTDKKLKEDVHRHTSHKKDPNLNLDIGKPTKISNTDTRIRKVASVFTH